MKTKLMLAASASSAGLAQLNYPLLGSPKIDGVRAVITRSGVYSRNGKLIPNDHVQRLLTQSAYVGLDGELVVGAPTWADSFNRTQSAVMSRAGEPAFNFFVFDAVPALAPGLEDAAGYATRLEFVARALLRAAESGEKAVRSVFKTVPTKILKDTQAVESYEESCLQEGYEGVMLRNPEGLYKHGRSTLKEQWLLKLKRFEDSEMTVHAAVEQQHNYNMATVNALGQTKRSSRKAGLKSAGVLGALVGVDIHNGRAVRLGAGFTANERKELWARKEELIGLVARYKYFAVGTVVAPRFPVFSGFRKDI